MRHRSSQPMSNGDRSKEQATADHAQLNQGRDQVQKYLDLVENMLVALNRKGEVELINRHGCEILGFDEDQIIGKNWFDNFLLAANREGVKRAFELLIAGELEPVEFYENPVLPREGNARLIAWRNTLLKDDSGNISGTLSSGEDVTDRKETEARIQAILDTTVDGIITINEGAVTCPPRMFPVLELGYG
jgi:PAS domain S-box-containing protein